MTMLQSWFAALLRLVAPRKHVVDAECKHCWGMGYDASGYRCTCVKESS